MIHSEGHHLSWVPVYTTAILLLFTLAPSSSTTASSTLYDDKTINWQRETIDEGEHIGPERVSVAVNPEGGVHVSYHDAAVDGLRYAYKPAGGNWTSKVIDSPGVGNYSRIGVDSAGVVHIVYEDHVGNALKHAVKRLLGDWNISDVDPDVGIGRSLELAFDTGDMLSIAYLDISVPSIKLATMDEEGHWNVSSAIVGGHTYWGRLDFTIGVNGSKHLVYLAGDFDLSNLQGYYSYKWSGEEWLTEEVPFHAGVGSYLSIALNDTGDPYVVVDGYCELFSRSRYGHWSSANYLTDDSFSRYGDVCFDSKGEWLVCSRHTGSRDLRYYRSTPVGRPRVGIVDDRYGTGVNASMTVGPNDRFHIVYYNERDGTLEYATDVERPSAPVGLTATGRDRDVLLEWGMPARMENATSVTFSIYRDDSSPTTGYSLYKTGWAGTSFSDTTVSNGELYSYIVAAVNPSGEGDFSASVQAGAWLHPTTPLNVTARAGPDYVVLRWEPPLDTGGYTITGYRIYWATGTLYHNALYRYQPLSEWSNMTVDGSTRSYNHTNLLSGVIYNYRIVALHPGGEGESSLRRPAVPIVPPKPPTALTAHREDGRVILNWTRPVDDGGCRLTAYRVYRGTSPSEFQLLTTINGNGSYAWVWNEPLTTLVDDGTVPLEVGGDGNETLGYLIPKDAYDAPGGLDENVTYYYSVSAVQQAGEGPTGSVLKVPSERASSTPMSAMVFFFLLALIVVCAVIAAAAIWKRRGI